MFGFTQPGFSGVESTFGGAGGIPGVVNAQVIITNGVGVPPGTTIVVNCIPSATDSALAICKLNVVMTVVLLP